MKSLGFRVQDVNLEFRLVGFSRVLWNRVQGVFCTVLRMTATGSTEIGE